MLLMIVMFGTPLASQLDLHLTPIEIEPDNAREYLPNLEVRAAFELRSSDSRFGGISGALVEDQTLWLLSDRAYLFKGKIIEDGAGQIRDLTDWHVWPLSEGDEAIDSEALALGPIGSFAVAMEGNHRIRCLNSLPPTPTLEPCGLAHFRPQLEINGGMEAVTDLGDQSLLALVESAGDKDGNTPSFMISKDLVAISTYRPAKGFRPTGADRLDDRIYVLERRLSLLGGWQARIARLNTADLNNSPIVGLELGRIGVGMDVDNFEAIAARHGQNGNDELLIFSDDNYLPVQRTLFYQLAVRTAVSTN